VPTFQKFYATVEAIHEKKIDLSSDVLKLMLTNTAPSLSNTQKTDITEISAGNGYSAGGSILTVTSSAQSSGLYSLVVSDLTITASGGSIGPWRYAVIYSDTSTNDLLLWYADYGYSITVASGQSVTFDFDPAGIYTAS
jgi:PKD repeat protein